MKISPMRSLFLMWLLCSVWMLLVWRLVHHAAASLSAGPSLPAEVAANGSLAGMALWGGMVLTLFLAFYLALAIRIDLGRLRIAARELTRDSSAALPDMAPEWLGLLDDVRIAARRQQQELAISRQELDVCEQRLLAEQARAAAALAHAESATLRVRRAQADVRRGLAALPMPDAAQGQRHEQAKSLLQPALDRLAKGLENLDSALQPLSALLDAAPAMPTAPPAPAAESRPESRPDACASRLLEEAGRLAESLQLLGLNFRLALERLGPELGEDHPELDMVIQDLEPMCADAMTLQEAAHTVQDGLAKRAEPPKANAAPSSWPLPDDETRRILAEVGRAARDAMQAMAAALRQGRQGLDLVQEESGRTQDAGELEARAVLERLDLDLRQAPDAAPNRA